MKHDRTIEAIRDLSISIDMLYALYLKNGSKLGELEKTLTAKAKKQVVL